MLSTMSYSSSITIAISSSLLWISFAPLWMASVEPFHSLMSNQPLTVSTSLICSRKWGLVMWKPWAHQQAWEWNGRPRSRILRKFIVIKERPWAAAKDGCKSRQFYPSGNKRHCCWMADCCASIEHWRNLFWGLAFIISTIQLAN